MTKKKVKETFIVKKVYLDSNNRNCLIFEGENGNTQFTCVPPGKNRTDLILSHNENIVKGSYHFRFEGVVVVTDDKERIVIFDNKIVDRVSYE